MPLEEGEISLTILIFRLMTHCGYWISYPGSKSLIMKPNGWRPLIKCFTGQILVRVVFMTTSVIPLPGKGSKQKRHGPKIPRTGYGYTFHLQDAD